MYDIFYRIDVKYILFFFPVIDDLKQVQSYKISSLQNIGKSFNHYSTVYEYIVLKDFTMMVLFNFNTEIVHTIR